MTRRPPRRAAFLSITGVVFFLLTMSPPMNETTPGATHANHEQGTARAAESSMRHDGTPGEGPSLEPCPTSPNCVSSMARQGGRQVAPLAFEGEADLAWETLRQALPRVDGFHALEREGPGFLHAVFRTPLGFKDDVTFSLAAGEGVVHVRSASRLGYWDLGKNRRRVERLRETLPPPFLR